MRRGLLLLFGLCLAGSMVVCQAQDTLVRGYQAIRAVRVGDAPTGKREWVRARYPGVKKTYFQVLPGYEFVTWVRDAHGRAGWLQRVQFRFRVPRCCRTADQRVAVRVYRYDAAKDQPGDPLLQDTVIVHQPKRRHRVDLSRYGIPFPLEGLCVGVKWLSQEGCTSDRGRQSRNIQPLIGITYSADAPGYTWKRYDQRPDLGWLKDVDIYPSRMASNLRVQAEVVFAE